MRWRCGAPARATCSASPAPSRSGRRGRVPTWPAQPKTSRLRWRPPIGSAFRQARAPRDRASTTGRMWSWPTSTARPRATRQPWPVDARPAGPAQHRRRRMRVLRHVVPGRHGHRHSCRGGRAALDYRGQLRVRQDRVRPRPQRKPVLARLAPPCQPGHAGVRYAGDHSPPREPSGIAKRSARAGSPADRTPPDSCAPSLIRWSLQEVRRIAARLAQRRIRPAHVIAWSLWRRAHQAVAQRPHVKRNL